MARFTQADGKLPGPDGRFPSDAATDDVVTGSDDSDDEWSAPDCPDCGGEPHSGYCPECHATWD